MRVIYVHQYYLTPEEGGAVRSYHLAKGMVEAGLEVEVITAHNKSYDETRIIDGVKVHYLPVSYDNDFGFFRRILAFVRFVSKSKRLIGKLERPQVLYITSTPLTTGLIGLWAKKNLSIPFIFEVRDLWPEAPIQVGAVRNKLLRKVLYDLEAKIYRNALKIVALSPGIEHYIRTKSPGAEIFLLPNFCDIDFFSPEGTEGGGRREMDKVFTISYTGAMGKINALQEFLYLAKEAQNLSKDWQFILMGKGVKEQELKTLAGYLSLDNVSFLPHGNKHQVREVLAVSDVAYISFDHFPVLETASPNKFFDALAMRLAIVINQKGWIHDLVKEHRLGFFHQPSRPGRTIQLLESLAENPQGLALVKKRSRDLAVRHFSKDLAVKKLLFVLQPERFKLNPIDGADILTV